MSGYYYEIENTSGVDREKAGNGSFLPTEEEWYKINLLNAAIQRRVQKVIEEIRRDYKDELASLQWVCYDQFKNAYAFNPDGGESKQEGEIRLEDMVYDVYGALDELDNWPSVFETVEESSERGNTLT